MLKELRKMCPNCFQMSYEENNCLCCSYKKTWVKGEERALKTGTLLGNRYLIGRILGIGGFGISYKAYDTLYSNVCAIKEFAPFDLVSRSENSNDISLSTLTYTTQFEHGLMRFIEEAQILQRLQPIQEVVQVYECFRENNTAYFSMEFLDGTNLKNIIRAMGGSVNRQDITKLIISIASAMEVIHKTNGVLHRDISPENIYILKDGNVKLLDFGSARNVQSKGQQGFSVEFKPGFAPLEQYSKDGNQGTYTDVYALACTYYYALTGCMIPSAIDRLEGREYTSLKHMIPGISPTISDGVDNALDLDYRSRIQTMREFIDILSENSYVMPSSFSKEKKAVPYLEVKTGELEANKWNLPPDTEVLFGRSPILSNIILTTDPLISKIHCKIIYNQKLDVFLLSDLSRNGTYVENKRLVQGEIYKFKPGFQFSLAGRICVIKAGVSYE